MDTAPSDKEQQGQDLSLSTPQQHDTNDDAAFAAMSLPTHFSAVMSPPHHRSRGRGQGRGNGTSRDGAGTRNSRGDGRQQGSQSRATHEQTHCYGGLRGRPYQRGHPHGARRLRAHQGPSAPHQQHGQQYPRKSIGPQRHTVQPGRGGAQHEQPIEVSGSY